MYAKSSVVFILYICTGYDKAYTGMRVRSSRRSPVNICFYKPALKKNHLPSKTANETTTQKSIHFLNRAIGTIKN